MNTGLKIFTIVFTLICLENVFRIADFIGAWTYPIIEASEYAGLSDVEI